MLTEHTQQTDSEFIAGVEERMKQRAAESEERKRQFLDFMATQAQTHPCDKHPDVGRPIDLEATYKASKDGTLTPGYGACAKCSEEHTEKLRREWLAERGVPLTLQHATLGNWDPGNLANGNAVLDSVRAFAKKNAGFLLLLGGVGTGKSHLAVGLMRTRIRLDGDGSLQSHYEPHRQAYFVKQSTLLRKLRFTYRDKNAEDPVEICQQTRFLVLDEAGFSGGGKDELPAIHEILDYRHCHKKPTVITGNLDWAQLAEGMGSRMVDRLRESAFGILELEGPSYRQKANEYYWEKY